MDDALPALAHQFGGGPAERFLVPAIGEDERAILVAHPDQGGGAIGKRAESRLALAHLSLRRLALRDVERGADRAHAAAAFEDAAPLGGNPADHAIFLADRAVFDVILGAPIGIERGQEGVGRCLHILGMQAFVEIVERHRCTRRNAEHRARPIRPFELVGDNIQVPGADLGHLRGKIERSPANLELLLEPDPIGDVVTLDEDCGDLALIVEDRLIEEIEQTLLGRVAGRALQPDPDRAPHIRFAAGDDLVEQGDETLT